MKVERRFIFLAMRGAALATACGGDDNAQTGAAGAAQGGAAGQSTSTTTTTLGAGGGGGSGGSAEAGNRGGGGSAADGAVEASPPSSCPHFDLGRTVPATYLGSTVGLPNLVTSKRLEWTDAPDDSLAFEAPSDGDYVFTFDSPNNNMGASAEDYSSHKPWTSASCPAAGATNEIDGIYTSNNPMYPVPLEAGQKIVIWVSVTSFSATKSGAYKLTVSKK